MDESYYARIQEITQLFDDDKLLQAHKKLVALKADLVQLNTNEGIEAVIREIQTNKKISLLEQEAPTVMNLLSDIASCDGWNLVHELDGIKTWYRHESANPVHSLKMEGIIHQPLFNVCSVIYEIDLYTSWIPRLIESKVVQSSSRFRKICYCRLSSIWPVASRDTCMYGYGVDMLEEDSSVVIVVRSCKETDEHDHPPLPSGVIRVDTERAGFLLKPSSPTSTHVSIITNTDPKITFIPYWLLNLVTKHLAHLFFVMLRRQAAACDQIGSPYHYRISTNPIYADLKAILDRFNETGIEEESISETNSLTNS